MCKGSNDLKVFWRKVSTARNMNILRVMSSRNIGVYESSTLATSLDNDSALTHSQPRIINNARQAVKTQ